jgi:hypothetical protein
VNKGGQYANRGVEYRVVLSSGRWIVIAPVRDTDARLLVSRFFEERKDDWFAVETLYGGQFANRIPNDVDVVALIPGERAILEQTLEEHKGDVDHAAWYDINTITY